MTDRIDDMPVTLAFGQRADQNDGWRNISGTLGQVFDANFTEFAEGPKEGRCFIQGQLVADARGSKEVVRNHLMMFDSDSGAPLDELQARVERLGLYACIWTTHSHGKSTTTIAEDELLRWARKAKVNLPDDDDAMIEFVGTYLSTVKEYDASIADSITAVSKRLERGGMKYTVLHAPMTKARVLLVLDQPFEFIRNGMTQAACIDEWKAVYRNVGDALGLVYDAKCQDPARLFYLPRRPIDSNPGDYEIRWVDGTTLDLMTYKTATKASRDRNNGQNDRFSAFGGGGDTQGVSFVTPGLAKFLRKHNKWFLATQWLQAIAPDDVRGERGEKLEHRCPADEMHGNAGDETDRAFFATDGDGERAFGMHCGHATCSAEATAGGKNWWYLDKACQHYGVEHANELLQFVAPESFEGQEEAAEAAPTVEETNELRTNILALNQLSPSVDKQAVLDALASMPVDALYLDLVALYRERTRTSKADFDAAMRASKEAARARAQEDGDNVIDDGMPPVPINPADTTVIWQHWDYEDQVRCAKARVMKVAKEKPRLFRDVTGKFVRAYEDSDRLILDDMTQGGAMKWSSELARLPITFKRMTMEGIEQSVRPFDAVTAEFSAMTPDDMALPRLRRVVDVPVFGKTGSLRTEKGYDPASEIYVLPAREYEAVPDVITDEHLDAALWWLGEPIRDIPFSDAYGAEEELPIRLEGDLDEDGHPLPNLDRGRSSRVNLLALMIQHFAREMIDGPCPLYFIDKPAPGTGASLLMNIVSIVQCGQPAPMLPWKTDEGENTKTLTSIMRQNPAMIFWDNVNVKVDSGVLAGAITSGLWQDRILGESTLVSLPITQELVIAGNNVSFSSELFRRICPIRLDARVARPALDRPTDFYKYPDVLEFVTNNRPQIVWSIHVLIRNWQQQGRPHGDYVLQSFTNWSRVMGGILKAAGIDGFMGKTRAFYEAENTDTNVDSEVAAVLFEQMQNGEYTAKEMFGMLVENTVGFGGGGNGPPTLKVELDIRGNNERAMLTSFGGFLKKFAKGTYEVKPGLNRVLRQRMRDGRTRYSWATP